MFPTKTKLYVLTAATVAMFTPFKTALATVGQLPLCVGTYKCGMAGAGLAVASDPTAATANPALAARMGNEAIINVGWFRAKVNGTIQNTTHGNNTGDRTSNAKDFLNGSLGVNYKVGDDMGLNISIYPGGGGATDWDAPRTADFGGGTGATDGTDHQIRWRMFNMQAALGVSPSDSLSLGAGIVISRSDMKTDSLDNGFSRPDAGPYGAVDRVWGYGGQVGAVWDVTDQLAFAAKYHSRVKMQRFKKYLNIFNSSVDRPPIWSIGTTFKATPDTEFSVDFKYIENSAVKTISSAPQNDGGFGWDNVKLFMVGVEHQASDVLTLRAGYSYNNSPVNDEHVFANVLFPAIVEHHLTAGATYKVGEGYEIGASAYVTPESKVTDSGLGDAFSANNAGTVLRHQQYGAQLSLKYLF